MTNGPQDGAREDRHPRSAELYDRACRVIPGGVSSPVRAFRAVGGTPLFIARASGAQVFDADGRAYLDFVGSWGPLIAGHAHPAVIAAVTEALTRGMTYGAPCAAEVELAERVVASYPAAEQVRFVSSGTEAVMSAIRVARAFTGRDLIVKFAGCYHGHADHLLVAAGSGLATFGRPSSAGVPAAFTACTRVLPLDDEASVAQLFEREGTNIAAVIIEPVPANHGLLPQRREVLQALRTLTGEYGALLVFDEVISGFRLGRGGAAELLGITPDLATFGKVIGGGMPVGAFGGARRIMARLAPDGDTYQAGTLSGNPVAMTAGLATLDLLVRESGWQRGALNLSACCSRCWRARHFRCTWCGSARSSGFHFTRRARRAPRPRSPGARSPATRRSFTACSTAASTCRRPPTRRVSCRLRTPRPI
jgi:glutamate-1-semialdehyde 2,1-aminomutase